MSVVSQGSTANVHVPNGRRIKITTAGVAYVGTGNRRITDSSTPYIELAEGPNHYVAIDASVGDVTYTIFYSDVVPFTGNRTLTADDNGKVLRCDSASNVTITVPADLPECFSCGFMMWSTGTIAVSAGSGATNRSGVSTLSTQYASGALLVGKNADDVSAEFILSDGFA